MSHCTHRAHVIGRSHRTRLSVSRQHSMRPCAPVALISTLPFACRTHTWSRVACCDKRGRGTETVQFAAGVESPVKGLETTSRREAVCNDASRNKEIRKKRISCGYHESAACAVGGSIMKASERGNAAGQGRGTDETEGEHTSAGEKPSTVLELALRQMRGGCWAR